MIQLRDYQLELRSSVYQQWEEGAKAVLAVCPTGGGKCLGVDTPVKLHSGRVVPVQDIKVGDVLMGPISSRRNVLSTTQGRGELYKIIPIKGDPWICNDVHILTLVHTQTGHIIDIPLDQYLKKSNNFKHLHKLFREGVEYPHSNVSFDPYMLGLFLAEGTNRTAQISTPDTPIIFYCMSYAEQNNMKATVKAGRGCFSISFADVKQGWYKNKVRNISKECTGPNDRYIPSRYMYNSRSVRLQVLAGLLDGDGHTHNNSIEIITAYPALKKDILQLCRDLGFAAYCRDKTVKGKVYHRIGISGDLDLIPMKVKRKQCSKRQQKKNVLRTGFTVEPIGEGDYYGFELDGDGRFLLGDNTVTHNTKTFCKIAVEHAESEDSRQVVAILVHRKELVQQISLTLAEEGILHNIIAQRKTITGIIAAQRRLYNRQFYHYGSRISVISVDTLNSRIKAHRAWAESVDLWITDEAAHLLKKNKWGKSVSYFPRAKGLGVTATPQRLDKRGLGSHNDGVFDTIVEGPTTRWLIDKGHLCRYKIAIPPSDYKTFLKSASSGSDYSKGAMSEASQKSKITGDVVESYKKFAEGKQAILFTTDIKSGEVIEENYKSAGIKAMLLHGLSTDKERLEGLIAFSEKRIQVLINIDLFDEGLDVPGIECVIMARPTMSLSKYLQMVGRGLRPAPDKDHLILIDHVGNVLNHGLPDHERKWSLERGVKRNPNANLMKICANVECNAPFDRFLTECPWCGFKAIPQTKGGSTPRELEQVDGDLELLDPEVLRDMEKATYLEEPDSVKNRVEKAAGRAAGIKAYKNQIERVNTQNLLVHVIAQWAGVQRDRYDLTDRQINKKFYLEFGQSITQALSEPASKMRDIIEALEART